MRGFLGPSGFGPKACEIIQLRSALFQSPVSRSSVGYMVDRHRPLMLADRLLAVLVQPVGCSVSAEIVHIPINDD